MSTLTDRFDPSNLFLLDGAGLGDLDTHGINPNEQLVLYNTSLTCFTIVFNDKTTDVMPPAWAKSFKKEGHIGKIRYHPEFALSLSLSSLPVSVCYGTVYESGEHITDVNEPLQYIVNVGNPVTVATANQVVSTGIAPGSTFVQGNPSGDTSPGGATNIKNNGQYTAGDATYTGQYVATGPSGAVATLLPNELTLFNGSTTPIDIFGVTPTVYAGTVSGNAVVYEWMKGSLKRCLIIFNNYQSASNNTYSLLGSYNGNASIDSGDIGNGSTTDGGISLLHSSAAITLKATTTLGGTAAGTPTSITVHRGYTKSEANGPFEQIEILSNTAAHNGQVEIVGH